MAYDLEEQEQLDALKDWWKLNGNRVMMAVTAVCVVYAGFQGWKYWQHSQATQASIQFEALVQASSADNKQVRSISGQIMEKYAGTPYAARAALLAARSNYDANDTKSAHAQLEWAMNHAQEDAIKAIAQLQLAGLQFDDKRYDEALKTLADKHDPAFDGLFADLKGDILVAQGKAAEAKLAYADALNKLDDKGRFRKFTEQKLDALGS